MFQNQHLCQELKTAPLKKHQNLPVTLEKPVVTLYGDSMVRGCGEILSSSLTNQDTCVLSTSGLTLDRASDQIGQLRKEFRDGDTFVLHIGTNNVTGDTPSQLESKYKNLISNMKKEAPNSKHHCNSPCKQVKPWLSILK